ncbi:dienelactone hydrolase [Hydrogenispora ethanolica]|jgi:dienelactone hydrolase|uniref:Dienelactone hydrolase n=1 Tax=Hydrogenispora ethanolica TaxID=1082276 RepID=A0A4R1S6M9_HYDET|nr:dienelactone hydrolase family protein [Hydrogenispora ethanolica]TCL74102.1 dienelactone hydrolase [Hydrogenispora ethanolica]
MGEPSRRLIILLHEIYGVNRHMEWRAERLRREGYEVLCPNLLGREPFEYEAAAEAYAYFLNEVGFEKAYQEARRIILDQLPRYDALYLMGFSAGATVAWRCSELGVRGAVGYYGSRIRDFAAVRPECPVLLFFPETEPGFTVAELVETLNHRPKVECHVFAGAHGFADPFSARYHQASAARAEGLLQRFLGEIG